MTKRLKVKHGAYYSRLALMYATGSLTILSLSLMGFGIYIYSDHGYSKVQNLLNIETSINEKPIDSYLLNFNSISIPMLLLGLIISCLSAFGLSGAYYRTKSSILICGVGYGITILGIVAIFITAIIYKYSLYKKFENEFSYQIKNGITYLYTGEMELNIKKEFEFKIKISSKLNFEWGKGKTYSKNSVKTTFTVFFDSFQVYFKCCGVESYMDYANSVVWNTKLPDKSKAKAPLACCRYNSDQRNLALMGVFPLESNYNYTCAIKPDSSNSNYEKGCLRQFNKFYHSILLVIFILTALIFVLQILGVLSSYIVYHHI